MTYFPAENMCLSSLSWESNIEEDSQTNGAFLSGKCKVSMIGLTAKKKKSVSLFQIYWGGTSERPHSNMTPF